MKVLFLGALEGKWKSGWQRCQVMKELGHEVSEFRHEPYTQRALYPKPVRALTGNHFKENVIDEFNRDLLTALDRTRPEVAWLEWPFLLRPETLREAATRHSNCRWVSFQDDNPFGARSEERPRWKLFLKTIPEFDLNFVKRDSDIPNYRTLGARKTVLFMHGFYAPLFNPRGDQEVPFAGGAAISFVGSPLDHRVAFIADLLSKYKVPLKIYGNRWNRTLCYYRSRDSFKPPVLGEDYVRLIASSRVNLGFVSSSNKDEYNMRTFEIPACKGFFLAERTPTHQKLYQEGTEAEFFTSVEECADKIRFYLRNESTRARIAENGYRRCVKCDYSLHRRIAEALQQVRLLSE